jgi:signal transduction histidine kinase/ActR/RegA family two-component response regulator
MYTDVNVDDREFVPHDHYTDGVDRLPREERSIAEFGASLLETYQRGETIAFDDVSTDSRLSPAERDAHLGIGVAAFIGVPLVKRGRLVAGLGVNSAKPRRWTQTELDVAREFLDRVWDALERARAGAAREELLAAVTAAHAEAQRANKAKDEFLATLSHELRTPLAAILLWAGALRSGAVPLSELSRAIDAIVQSAESQSRLIEDLLDLSRLASGKFLLSPSHVVVGSVVQAAIDVVRPSAQAKGITIEVEVPSGLGAAVLDQARVKQILWNLVSNAIKFTPEGGTVTVRARRNDGYLEIDVADTGEGIAPEFMPHIFEKFRQADMGETRRHMGLGIGLALSKQLIELHGGTIEAHSEGRGRGALFRVRIPWADSSEDVTDVADDTVAAGAEALAPLRGVHVLLVEDDVHTREAMRWMLVRAGAQVTAVGTGADALDALGLGSKPPREDAPEVVVTDLGLPGMSGFELVERIGRESARRGLRRPPACAVSAHARDIDRERAMQAGFELYVPKPVPPERLVEAVTELRDIAVARRV